MPKLDALRWVPKLLNAYIDAKVEYETNRRLQVRNGEEEPEAADPSEEPLRPAKKQRPRLHKPARRAGRKKVTRTLTEPGAVWLAKGTATPIGKQRHLDRLEMLRHQIAQMQKQLDRELQLLRRNM